MSPRALRRSAPVRVSPAEVAEIIAQAERLARAAMELGALHHPADLVQFRMRVRDVTAEAFPSPAEAARLVFAAFLNAARAFAHPLMDPETRTACAPMLREAARLCEDLISRHRTALARGTWAGRDD